MMCGRYTTEIETDEHELYQMLARAEQTSSAGTATPLASDTGVKSIRGREVFPSDAAAVLSAGTEHPIDAFLFRWGFPSSMDGKRRLLINARSESVLEKPSFAPHFLQQRCVIPTAGFFEWAHHGNRADPAQKYRFNLPQTGMLFLAGFYRQSPTAENEREFLILTREANDSMAPIHHRMPVILRREHIEEYLLDAASAQTLLNETPPVLLKRLVS